jgi:hypothetical protein
VQPVAGHALRELDDGRLGAEVQQVVLGAVVLQHLAQLVGQGAEDQVAPRVERPAGPW